MKILIDINHPAHVHYFRNFYKIMKNKGHEILIISRNKEIEHQLLAYYKIPFIDRGKGGKSKLGKVFYFLYAVIFILRQLLKFKPNIIMSFGTPYPAIAGWLIGIPHISFNDTETAKMHHALTDPFSKSILTPNCYNIDLGPKQIKFRSLFELSYLLPKYYTPDKKIRKILNIQKDEKYIVVRFVSWNAVHDIGEKGLSNNMRERIVFELSKYAKVLISSEGELSEKLKKYQINISPEKMHDILASSSLFIGESPTMTTESALLGVPAICISSWACNIGNFEELTKNGLINCFKPDKETSALNLAKELLKDKMSKEKWHIKNEDYLYNSIDITDFMTWFIENYPKSANIIQKDPDYQNKFIWFK